MNTPWSSAKRARSAMSLDLLARPRKQVRAGVAVHDLRKALDRLLLLLRERPRDLDAEAVVDVAAPTPGELLGALAAKALHAAVRGAGRHADLLRAAERRHLHGAAGDRLHDRDRDVDLEVVALAPEDGRGRHVRDHVEVAAWTTAESRLALAGQPDAAALADAGRDLHPVSLRLVRMAGPHAGRARILDH